MEDVELMCVMIIALLYGKSFFEKLDTYLEALRNVWKEVKSYEE